MGRPSIQDHFGACKVLEGSKLLDGYSCVYSKMTVLYQRTQSFGHCLSLVPSQNPSEAIRLPAPRLDSLRPTRHWR